MKTPALSLESLKALLQAQPHYLDQEGELNTALLYKLAQQCDRSLLELLFADTAARKAFFLEQGGVTVFVRDHFIDYIQHKRFVANSYTAYRNKIGLHDDRDYLKKNKDIVLAFPFKDCVLEGGQCKDDAKRSERYYHRILAIEELDRLLEPKVLTNARRYTKEGPSECREFTRNKSDNTISDNLIIKGNNLIALHSINEQFAKKVQLIYIDPPYNTGNDSFLYNDNFNHSTWLVFIKNRLEIARELLRDDGVLFVQCDDNEQAYLKVLMDEVFGRENFVASLVYKRRKTQANLTKWIAPIHEYILGFAKSKNSLSINRIPLRQEYVKEMYKNPDNDSRGLWMTKPLASPDNSPNKEFELDLRNGRKIKARWRVSQKTYDQYLKDNLVVIPRGGEGMPRAKVFLKDNEGQIPNTLLIDVATNEQGSKEIELIFGSNSAFAYPKPEGLLQRIIEIATQPGDLVLDFCLGSGTTAAVAHKMARQYIGIEQMDYIQTIAVERLTKVIAGEQGGISKNVAWQGGGSFVYLELKAHNQTFIERITEASTQAQLAQIQQELLQNPDLDYRLNTQEVRQSAKDFSALSLENQRQALIDFLELNQLYVPYSERKDTRFHCTDKEINLSESFYKGDKA